jgi:type I restriction enzyme S subunit
METGGINFGEFDWEAGSMMMGSWPKVKLADCVDLLAGFPFKSNRFTDNPGDVPLVKGENVSQGRILWDISKRWPVSDWEIMQKFHLVPGDVVVAMDRPWIPAGLKWSVIREGDPKALLVQRCARLRSRKECLNQIFLRFVIGGPEFEGYVKPITTGVNVPHISGNQILDFEFTLPPLPTQRRIAAILSAYDDLIENSQRRIKILEEMARRLYREWFVYFRFPGHEGCRLVDSPLGEIPEGWAICELNDFVQLKSGFAFKSGTFTADGGHRLVTIKNVQDGVFNPDSDTRMSEVPANMPTYCVLNNKDILLSLTGNVGRVCLVHDGPFLLNQRVSKLAPVEAFDWAMVYCMFRQQEMRVKLEKLSNGVAQQNLSPILASKIDFAKPPRELRRQFSILAEPMGLSIVQLCTSIQNLRRTRDLLLPRLLSGQIDVEALPEPVAFAP